jgi:uncharacterized membrane protein
VTDATSPTTLRARLPLAPPVEPHFRWRGHEVTRLEGFSDAVFAFAVTLLVVALEVPRTFEGLQDVLRGFPGFVLSFVILMAFWNAHFRYFRRFGLQTVPSRVMTMGILVLVLFFVYPLKFLFTMVTVNLLGLDMHEAPHLASHSDVVFLYTAYGLGFAGVWSLYAALYAYALRQRAVLQLDANELVLTRGSFFSYAIHVGVCLTSVLVAHLTDHNALPGLVYLLLIPLQTLEKWWFRRQLK